MVITKLRNEQAPGRRTHFISRNDLISRISPAPLIRWRRPLLAQAVDPFDQPFLINPVRPMRSSCLKSFQSGDFLMKSLQ